MTHYIRGWHSAHDHQPPARSLDSPGQTGPQLLSCCPTLEERTSPPDNFKKITDMSWMFLSSDMIWILRYNCCVNSNIRQRQLQLYTSPLWIELSRNPFPYRPELARIRRNVRTLGKDHSSSVVRIPTHTFGSYFPRVVSHGEQSQALLSKYL